MTNEIIAKIVSTLLDADQKYHNGIQSPLTDEQYDQMKYTLRSIDPKNAYLKKVGAAPLGTKAKHKYRLGSLDKITTPAELFTWITAFGKIVPAVVIQDKLDGSSIGLYYESGFFVKAITRGDGLEGEDVTENIRRAKGFIAEIPNFTGMIRCEALLTLDTWTAMKNPGANPRNTAAGLVRKSGGDSDLLSLYAIDCETKNPTWTTELEKIQFLQANKFLVPRFASYTFVKDIQKHYDDTLAIRSTLSYEIDAIVIKINDLAYHEDHGFANPNWAVAYKFPSDKKHTILRDIEWTVGSDAQLTPNAQFDNVSINGVNINCASLHNWDNVTALGLSLGDTIEVIRANDVIPQVTSKLIASGKPPIGTPDCPHCHVKAVYISPHMYCPNNNCQGKAKKILLNFFKKTDMMGFGESTVDTLVNNGIVEISDLVTKKIDWRGLFGTKIGVKLMKEFDSNARVLTVSKFLGSLGIYGIGRREIDNIVTTLKIPNLSAFAKVTPKELLTVKGIGPTMVRTLLLGLIEKQDTINAYIDAFYDYVGYVNSSPATTAPTTNIIVCFTGKGPQSREILSADALKRGFAIRDDITSDLTHLVASDHTTGKALKAANKNKTTRKNNPIQVISYNDYLKL